MLIIIIENVEILFEFVTKKIDDVFLFEKIVTNKTYESQIFDEINYNTNVVFAIRHYQIENFLVNNKTKFDVFDFFQIDEITIVVNVHTLHEIVLSRVQFVFIVVIFDDVKKFFE